MTIELLKNEDRYHELRTSSAFVDYGPPDKATMVACGNANGETRTAPDVPDGLMAFRMRESNNSGYVDFVVVYDAGDDVLIQAYIFPGARR